MYDVSAFLILFYAIGCWCKDHFIESTKPVADLGGGRERRAPPPLAQNFFIFMQFSGKIGQIIGWRPPLGLVPPPLGNPGSATANDAVLQGNTHDDYLKTHMYYCKTDT